MSMGRETTIAAVIVVAIAAVALATVITLNDDSPSEDEGGGETMPTGTYTYTIETVPASAAGTIIYPTGGIVISDASTVEDWTPYYMLVSSSGSIIEAEPSEVHWIRLTVTMTATPDEIVWVTPFNFRLGTDETGYESACILVDGYQAMSNQTDKRKAIDPSGSSKTITMYILTDGEHTDLQIIDTGIEWSPA